MKFLEKIETKNIYCASLIITLKFVKNLKNRNKEINVKKSETFYLRHKLSNLQK